MSYSSPTPTPHPTPTPTPTPPPPTPPPPTPPPPTPPPPTPPPVSTAPPVSPGVSPVSPGPPVSPAPVPSPAWEPDSGQFSTSSGSIFDAQSSSSAGPEQSTDPYSGNQSVDPSTGGHNVDPFLSAQNSSSAGDSCLTNPFTGSTSTDPYTNADYSTGQSQQAPDIQSILAQAFQSPNSSSFTDQNAASFDPSANQSYATPDEKQVFAVDEKSPNLSSSESSTSAQEEKAVTASPGDATQPAPTPEKESDTVAVGASLQLSYIAPTSGGGGIFGYNVEAFFDKAGNFEDLRIYEYSTPAADASAGFSLGLSLEGNVAVGSGGPAAWSGLFDSLELSIPTGTPVGLGVSPFETGGTAAPGADTFEGIAVGPSLGPPGAGVTTSDYQLQFSLADFVNSLEQSIKNLYGVHY